MQLAEAIKRVTDRGWMIRELGEYERGRVPKEQRWFASAHPGHLGRYIETMVLCYGNGGTPLAALIALVAEIDNCDQRHTYDEYLSALEDNRNARSA